MVDNFEYPKTFVFYEDRVESFSNYTRAQTVLANRNKNASWHSHKHYQPTVVDIENLTDAQDAIITEYISSQTENANSSEDKIALLQNFFGCMPVIGTLIVNGSILEFNTLVNPYIGDVIMKLLGKKFTVEGVEHTVDTKLLEAFDVVNVGADMYTDDFHSVYYNGYNFEYSWGVRVPSIKEAYRTLDYYRN